MRLADRGARSSHRPELGPGERHRGGDQRPAAGCIPDRQPPAERGDAVGDAHQAVPARIRAARAVIANMDVEHPVLDECADLRVLRVGVLDHVRQRLRHDEVGARLDLGREPLGRNVEPDRHLEPRHDGVEPRPQTAVREGGREDAVGELAQLLVAELGMRERVAHEPGRVVVARLQRPRRELQVDDAVDEPLLGAVVQVTHHATAGVVGSGQQARPRRGELVARFGVRDRRGDEVGELAEASLVVRGRRRLRLPVDRDPAPGPPFDHDRTADGAGHAERFAQHSRDLAGDAPPVLDARRRAGGREQRHGVAGRDGPALGYLRVIA